MVPLNPLIVAACQRLIVMYAQTELLCKIEAFKIGMTLNLTYQCHSGSNVIAQLNIHITTFY